MSADDNDATGRADSVDAGGDPPLTVELLADLQAGLLDDDTAARVRGRVRADPAATAALQALNRVRCDIAALATDSTDGKRRATHSMRPSGSRAKIVAAVAGLCAFVAAVGVGTAALVAVPAPPGPSERTAQHITVSSPAIPLSEEQILGLLDHSPDYGPLGDPVRRASCLSGLGYSVSTPIFGARPIEAGGDRGVLLVLPGDTPETLLVVVVPANCSAADTALLATTRLARR